MKALCFFLLVALAASSAPPLTFFQGEYSATGVSNVTLSNGLIVGPYPVVSRLSI